jgi:ATP-dependent DNA helicase RecQ
MFSKKVFGERTYPILSRHTDNKLNELIHILQRVPGSAIVYVRNRKKTKEIASDLRKGGIQADYFHAGLNRAEKDIRQNK